MTTTQDNFSLPQISPAPRPRRGGAAMIVGAVLVGGGFLTAVSGGALLGLFGDGQVLGSGTHTVATSASAVVADLGQINDIKGFEFLPGSPTLHISAENVSDKGVFIGVGPTDDVENYLEGVAVDRISDLEVSPFRMDTVRDGGSATAEAPGEQTFWVASDASSNDARLAWEIAEGRYEVVVMNADGSAGVLTAAEIGAGMPTSTGIWVTVLSIGILIMIGGGALILVGARRE